MIENIINVSAQVRKALELSNGSDHDDLSSFSFVDFPTGCCSDTSKVLQVVLYRLLGISTLYVSGKNCHSEESFTIRKEASHAWLEVDGWIIDITADQFNNNEFNNPPVIVSNNSEFHKIFNKINKRISMLPDHRLDDELHETLNYVLSHTNW